MGLFNREIDCENDFFDENACFKCGKMGHWLINFENKH